MSKASVGKQPSCQPQKMVRKARWGLREGVAEDIRPGSGPVAAGWSRASITHFCIWLSSTRTISSVLAGMFLNTSALSLRSMCGPSRSCSFLIWSSLEMSANSSRKPSRLLQQRARIRTSRVDHSPLQRNWDQAGQAQGPSQQRPKAQTVSACMTHVTVLCHVGSFSTLTAPLRMSSQR